MAIDGVEYGWRAWCSHAGCDQVLERWSDHGQGPPSILLHYESTSWAVWHDGPYGRPRYIVYCPRHADEFHRWKAEYDRWKATRSEIGRTSAQTLLGRLNEFLAPELRDARIGEMVRDWQFRHPEPVAPWRR
jgi:hypothetical protein